MATNTAGIHTTKIPKCSTGVKTPSGAWVPRRAAACDKMLSVRPMAEIAEKEYSTVVIVIG